MKQLIRLVLPLVAGLALLPQMIFHARQDRGLTVTAQGERRVALVIGNSAYALGALANPVNDARDIAATLRQANFEVLFGENQNRRQMRELIRQFGDKIRNGGVGLFFFAGHGVQVNSTNFLIPIGAEITKETEVEDEAVSVNFVLAQMEDARNKLNIVVLDACRDNPFARSFRTAGERGLAVTKSAPTGTLIAYATGAGSVASDGAGRNGLFTQELLTNLKTPGLTLESVFRRTRTTVRSKSNGQQVPYEYTSVEGEDFYFLPPNGAAPPPVTAPVTATGPPTTKPANSLRMSVAGVPLTAMSFVTASVDASGNVTNQRQEQCYGFVEDLGGVKLEMVEVPGGTFQMGSTSSAAQEAFEDAKRYNKDVKYERFSYEQPQHEVSVSGFAMGKYEVTQAQWQAVMGTTVSQQRDKENKDWPLRGEGGEYPMYYVSWEEAREFCQELSQRTGKTYRLPTEAEWEYAARAGTITVFAFGPTISAQIVNYNGNNPYQQAANGSYREKAVPVGGMGAANRFGLFDMHGNVWEWCEDMWHESYVGAPSDGSAWLSGGDSNRRALRGGSLAQNAWECRSARRSWNSPRLRRNMGGFRVVAVSRTQ
ncbi:MAG: SUMF1/EgtB/PvdO family nonheme iron enzyme [Acidobacteria bacterium]|nr:SUMF1/EgtB/PvdO family nonheme iron enzyme [Acidobacteriota bacterium]